MKLALVEVEELLESRLKESGLFKLVHREQSQFLDLEDEVFVELVLTDGSALNEVEKIVRHTAAELKTKGIRLESVVRALWEVVDVKYLGPARTAEGALHTAWEFSSTLRSGARECQVTVVVSWAARGILQQRLGHDVDNDTIARTVNGFLTLQLSHGGISYWDPLLNPCVNLFAAEMSSFLELSPAFEELRQAVADALEPPVLSSFLADLSSSGIKIRDFDAVLPKLSTVLRGPYPKGQVFSTNAADLFSKLHYTEQALLKQYFRMTVYDVEHRWPDLRGKFLVVFS